MPHSGAIPPIPPSPASQLMGDFTAGLSLTSPTAERFHLARVRSEASVPHLQMPAGGLAERRDSCGQKRRYQAPADSLTRTRTLASLTNQQLPPPEDLFAKPAPRAAKCGSPKEGTFAPPPSDGAAGFAIARRRVSAGRSRQPPPPSPIAQSPVNPAPPLVVCSPIEPAPATAAENKDKENVDPEYSVRQLSFDDPAPRSPRSPSATFNGSFSRGSHSGRFSVDGGLPALQMSSSPVLRPRGSRSKMPRLSDMDAQSGPEPMATEALATARSVPAYLGRPPLPVPVPCPSPDADRMELAAVNVTSTSISSMDVSMTSADGCPFEVASVLPTVQSSENPDVRCISIDTLAHLIENPLEHTKVHVVDCRYPYEFEGGHIVGAKNYWLPSDMEEQLFQQPPDQTGTETCIWIFHCEFSSKRAPHMWRHIRKLDRRVNTYPNLCYPQIFVVEGGYARFFARYRRLCTPPEYVPMNVDGQLDRLKQHKSELKKAYSRSQTNYLTRSASM
eukprot:tig00000459_g1064.t1